MWRGFVRGCGTPNIPVHPTSNLESISRDLCFLAASLGFEQVQDIFDTFATSLQPQFAGSVRRAW